MWATIKLYLHCLFRRHEMTAITQRNPVEWFCWTCTVRNLRGDKPMLVEFEITK